MTKKFIVKTENSLDEKDPDLVIGWENIAKLTPFSESTIRARYGNDLKKSGAVIKSYLGPNHRAVVWGSKKLIMVFFSRKMAEDGKV